MRVTCRPDEAYYIGRDDDIDVEAQMRAGIGRPATVEARLGPGYDGPVHVSAGCGYEFEVPDPDDTWDVNTDADGTVIERHLAPVCPECGRRADFLSVGVD